MKKDTKANPKSSDIEKRIEQLEEELKQLAFTIDTVEDEKLEITNQLKKALADYQNLERSINKRMELRLKQLKNSLAQQLLPIMDDIQYGVDASKDMQLDQKAESWLDGVKTTLNKMSTVLEILEVELMQVNPGDEFDSNLHEAVAVVPGEGENTILEVIQPGYLMDGNVLKPTKVVVVKNIN